MAIKLSKLAAAVSLACVLPLASADVLNFDDLVGYNIFTSNYKGFQFGNNNLLTNPWFYTDEVSPYYIPHSGTHFVATDNTLYIGQGTYAATQAITNTTAFRFDGAWFTGGDNIGYDLYVGSTIVASTKLTPFTGVSNVPAFVASGYGGLVTGVVIWGNQGYYAMDDFTYGLTPTVPEPETYAMMAVGLLGLGFVARRRKV